MRLDTWRNREGLGLSLGIHLRRSPSNVLKSWPVCSVVGAILPRRGAGWSSNSNAPSDPGAAPISAPRMRRCWPNMERLQFCATPLTIYRAAKEMNYGHKQDG